jgi:hypothetical protein
VVDFFKSELGFVDNEIIYFTENEAKTLVELLDQSRIFKHYEKRLVPRIIKYAEDNFRGSTSNPRQLLTVFLCESKDDTVRDFVINRNPEFAYHIAHFGNTEEKELETEELIDAKVKKILDETRDDLKTLNTIRFENLNHFFKSDRRALQFLARDKMFKPGSGHFDFIFDLPQNQKKDQTMKAKFNYLEKLPQRKFELGKHSIGCPTWIIEQKNENTGLQDKNQNVAKTMIEKETRKVVIVELVDINDKLCHDEIESRFELEDEKDKEKKIFSYIIDPDQSVEEQEKVRKEAKEKNAKVVPGLTERDEVVCIKTLLTDEKKKELLFTITLTTQSFMTFGKVSWGG